MIEEVAFDTLDLLIVFVAFAAEEHGIAGSRDCDRMLDGAGAVRIGPDFGFQCFGCKSLNHIGEDRIWIFAARVVGCENNLIGPMLDGLRHFGTFAAITVAAAAKEDNQSTTNKRTCRSKHGFERIGCVRIIDKDMKRRRRMHRLGTSHNAMKVADPSRNGRSVNP